MSLEAKSKKLKELISTYDTHWFLGDLSKLMKAIADNRANDQLGNLSSPLRQLYFLGGLLMSSDPGNGKDIMYNREKWSEIVVLLNEIEAEYDKLFFPEKVEHIDEQWKHVRKVAMPSFLSYFNQGPLNYEEQIVNWTKDLYTQLDSIIEPSIGVVTQDLIQFYNNLDRLHQKNFQSHSIKQNEIRPTWNKYSKIKMGVPDEVPDFIKEMSEKNRPLYTFMSDHGIIDRFYPEEIASPVLPIEKVNTIIVLLSTSRKLTQYLYYTSTKPGNPLLERPIVDIGDGMYQVFEIKQVMHAIENLLEQTCSTTAKDKTRLSEKKGKLLEDRIVELFSNFFKSDFKVFQGYYVDGCEQDILFLWKKYAFIVEAKGYTLREPLRDPDKAFVRIKDDFNSSIGYGYLQTKRVEKKFIEGVPLRLEDKNGNLIEEIDTSQFDYDFSIIVNLKSFGQIQNDLSTLLPREDEDQIYPWVVKLDDLEIFLLTLTAQIKNPISLVNYLLMREDLHGKLICSDELEVCGGFISFKINSNTIENSEVIVTNPDLATIFDQQYEKGLGLKNEKLMLEKKSGKHVFW